MNANKQQESVMTTVEATDPQTARLQGEIRAQERQAERGLVRGDRLIERKIP